MTRRTRGISLPQLVKELAPYLLRWRGFFGFCQTPRVLTNLEVWIRRRLRSYLWRQWQNGPNRFQQLRAVACRSSRRRLPPARRLGSGACQDIRRSNRPCATRFSTASVFPDSMSLPQLTRSNRRDTDPYARWCGRGGTARCPPIPINPPRESPSRGLGRRNRRASVNRRLGEALPRFERFS
jgi:hypothetical protein